MSLEEINKLSDSITKQLFQIQCLENHNEFMDVARKQTKQQEQLLQECKRQTLALESIAKSLEEKKNG